MPNRSVASMILPTLLVLMVVAGGCRREPPAVPPQTGVGTSPPAPAPRPQVNITASATIIQSGQPVTLNWTSTNATSLSLAPGVGTVAAQGSTMVTPPQSTTYEITATGPGGMANA